MSAPRRHLERSWFRTVDAILDSVRGDVVDDSTAAGRAARAAIPDRLRHAQIFMAWAVYYVVPEPLVETKKAMNLQ